MHSRDAFTVDELAWIEDYPAWRKALSTRIDNLSDDETKKLAELLNRPVSQVNGAKLER